MVRKTSLEGNHKKFIKLTPEEKKIKKKQYQEKYINKIGGIEKYREMVRKASLECYHKKMKNGELRARDRANPNYKPRIKKDIHLQKQKYMKFKKLELIDKIIEIEKILNQNKNAIII